jgi:hypothetical protein
MAVKRKKTYPWNKADLAAWANIGRNVGTGRDLLSGTGYEPTPQAQKDPAQLDYSDPQYISALAQGNLPFEQGLARLPGDVGQLAGDYGFTYDYKPGEIDPNTGLAGDPSVSITGVDASNPYSSAALLQKSYDQQKAGNTTSYAAQGQLYSGSLGNAQTAAKTGYDTGYNQLTGGFKGIVGDWIRGLGSSRLGAGAAKTTALGDLQASQVANPGATMYGGVGYQPNAQGFLAPLPGQKPTAQSVLASKSLLGTNFAAPYRPKKKRP